MVIRFFLVLLAAVYAHAIANCDNVPNCAAKLDADGLPLTEKAIQQECKEFREFQECVNSWGKDCMTTQEFQAFSAKLEQPYKFEGMICTDEKYRSDYLKEKESIEKISDDWNKCTASLTTNLKEGILKNPFKAMENMCCAVHIYDECTVDICKDKCTPEASKIIDNIIEMSKNALGIDCKDANTSECEASKSSYITYSITVSIVMMTVVALIR